MLLKRINHFSHLILKILEKLQKSCPRRIPGFNWWNADRDALYDRYDEMIDISIDPHYAAIIRKAWDMGVEQVVMQTVIQIDGDMISRIQKGYEGRE